LKGDSSRLKLHERAIGNNYSMRSLYDINKWLLLKDEFGLIPEVAFPFGISKLDR